MTESITFERGEIIFLEGEMSTKLYVLKSGEVEVLKDHKLIRVMKDKHAFFGEMAYLLGERRTATLRAKTRVEVTEITFEHGQTFDEGLSRISMSLMKIMAKRLDDTTRRVSAMNRLQIFHDKICRKAADHPELMSLIKECEKERSEEEHLASIELMKSYMMTSHVWKKLLKALEDVIKKYTNISFEMQKLDFWEGASLPLGSMSCVKFTGEREGILILDMDENLEFAVERKMSDSQDVKSLSQRTIEELKQKSSHFNVHMGDPITLGSVQEIEDSLGKGPAIELNAKCESGKMRMIYQLT
jgi:CRP-like cAMP-binding protein